jgi:hypothetical protein
MSDGSVEYMSRMKGVSQSCIQIEAAAKNMSLWQLYDDMINGTIHTFDLSLGGPSFKMDNNFSIKSREHFKRRIGVKKSSD